MSQLQFQNADRPAGFVANLPTLILAAARRLSFWAWLIVVLPTILAALYFFVIASDMYVSETRFIVRSPGRETPTLLGSILQTTGFQRSTDDTASVQSYITSRDAVQQLERNHALRDVFGRPEGDLITRFPNLVYGPSFEALYKHYQRFINVSVDSQTGVTTLQVHAYRPEDSRAICLALLEASERLVNDLNRRAESDAVQQAQMEVERTQARLAVIQQQMTGYRVREDILDPRLTSTSLYTSLNGLVMARAIAAAQLSQLQQDSPENPSIPAFRSRLRALDGEIARMNSHATGIGGSVANKLGGYERLQLAQTIAEKSLAAATQTLEISRLEAQRHHLYVERISRPSLPDYPLYPRRILWFSFVFAASILIYGIACLLIAGIREHNAA